jgi:hypothetical protein
MKTALRSALLLAALAVATAAGAQSQPGADNTDKVVELVERGQKKVEKGLYEDALKDFEEAEKLGRVPTITVLRAQTHEKLGQLREAEIHYRRVADALLGPNPKPVFKQAQAEANAALESLTTRIPKLTVQLRGAPPGARVLVDGNDVTASLPGPLPLNPGTRKITVNVGDTSVASKEVKLDEGKTETVEIDLTPPAVPTATATATSTATAALTAAGSAAAPIPSATASAGPSLALPLTAFGVGAAGLIVGAVTGGLTFMKMGEIRKVCGEDLICTHGQADQVGLDSARAVQHVANVGFVVAGLGAAVGITLLVLRPRSSAPEKVGVRVGPTSLVVNGAF